MQTFPFTPKELKEFLKKAKELVDIQYVNDLNMGFRPCSPDGFPIIGRRNNLVLVTGACRLGWSYGPAMGRYAVDLALDKVKDLGYISRYYHE